MPVADIIAARRSCRSYERRTLESDDAGYMSGVLGALSRPPFESVARFRLIAASGEDTGALKGLGTYGMIRNPAAFIVGAVEKSAMDLEDYGYLMEASILAASDRGLGSCWLGGSFTKSSFAVRIGAGPGEIVPAVASLGYPASRKTATDTIVRASAGSDRRKPWSELFFRDDMTTPLTREAAGRYADVLDMVRLAPSASNKQPWRIVRDEAGAAFHLYLEPLKSYQRTMKLLRLANLQRVDMGIAICHFELTALELGLKGRWKRVDARDRNSGAVSYIASWVHE
jgi:nitroreductase